MALLAVGFGSTLVIRRRFDPIAVLDSMSRYRATALIAVPVMLSRLAELDAAEFAGRDLSALRIVFVAGSQLGADLCRRVTAIFGPWSTTCTAPPRSPTRPSPRRGIWRPNRAASAPRAGPLVKILDDDGSELPAGRTGRIFVGNAAQFEGYTGGGGKELVGRLMSTGDVGHFDAAAGFSSTAATTT